MVDVLIRGVRIGDAVPSLAEALREWGRDYAASGR